MKSKIENNEYSQAVSELHTLGDWVRFAASCMTRAEVYFGHGTDNAWDEAVQLVLQLLHLPPDANPLVFHTRLIDAERLRVVDALRARIEARKPLPYITHQAWCMGLPFYVDERVLIPRSPFAEWIAKHFEPWIDYQQVSAILEIGTGSGCLAIACALQFPDARVDAVDVSADALAVAKQNVARHHVEEQVELLLGDGYGPVATRQYDIIFSNPPYVGAAEMATLPAEYAHEPRGALEAADNGLALVKRIIAEATTHLRPGGILVVEVGNSDEALQAAMPEVPFVWLEQEQGGHGLFLLTYDDLQALR